jgi:coenzyme F420-reducing hydrogenase gamma subunit
MSDGKPIIGFSSIAARAAFQLIFSEHVLETLGKWISVLRMLQSGGVEEGPFDVALIEGTITEPWQVEQLCKIRSVSKYVIPIGSCAVCGGVPAIKNNEQEYPIQNRVYEDTSKITSIRAHSIDQYVPVDGYIKGCPMGERDLVECITSLLLDKRPEFIQYPVCIECKLKHNICVLVAALAWARGQRGCAMPPPTIGPVTAAGARTPKPGYWPTVCPDGTWRDDIFRRFTEFGEPAISGSPGG